MVALALINPYLVLRKRSTYPDDLASLLLPRYTWAFSWAGIKSGLASKKPIVASPTQVIYGGRKRDGSQ
jgi:hypothetical protein